MRKVALIELAVCLGISSFLFSPCVTSNGGSFGLEKALRLVGVSSALAQSPEGEPNENPNDAGKKGGDKGKGEKDTEPDTLTPGMIASAGTSHSRSVGTDANLDMGLANANPSPVTGSVGYTGGRCIVSVTNGSKKNTYSVTYAVEGYDGDNKAFNKGFVATLAPSKAAGHEFACKEGLSLRLMLRKGNKKK